MFQESAPKKASNKAVQSNWLALKKQLVKTGSPRPQSKAPQKPQASSLQSPSNSSTERSSEVPQTSSGGKWHKLLRHRILALDCEMVGIGLSGKVSALARCSVVDFEGNVVYDEFVQPKSHVTDFRTKWSGIRKGDISAKNAVTLEECQEKVAALFKDKILVGHALKNDLTALLLSHPKHLVRDTARYRPYMRKLGAKFRPRALKDLTLQFFKKQIQQGEHDSVEDARCALNLYRRCMDDWEEDLRERKRQASARGQEKARSLHAASAPRPGSTSSSRGASTSAASTNGTSTNASATAGAKDSDPEPDNASHEAGSDKKASKRETSKREKHRKRQQPSSSSISGSGGRSAQQDDGADFSVLLRDAPGAASKRRRRDDAAAPGESLGRSKKKARAQ